MSHAKMQNIKSWIKDHSEEIAIGAVFTTITAAVVAVTIYAVKEQSKIFADTDRRRNEYVDFVNDALSKGTQIFNLADGSMLTVDKDGNKTIAFIV